MIRRFFVKNYKALKDVRIDLTPFHVLIGPNDSGKTSLLEALVAYCRSTANPLIEAFAGPWTGRELVWHHRRDLLVTLGADLRHSGKEFSYSIACEFAPQARDVHARDETLRMAAPKKTVSLRGRGAATAVCRIRRGENLPADQTEAAELVLGAIRNAELFRWNPQFLALPVAADATRGFHMDPSGFGLAQCLDYILGVDRSRFDELERRFVTIFPHIRQVQLVPAAGFRAPRDYRTAMPVLQAGDGKQIVFKFVDSEHPVPASQASDGILLVLAYLALLSLPEPPSLLVLEEPENGIHPRRLKEVLAILRDLRGERNDVQLLLTTHSPYVLDLFEPKEVTLCVRDEEGSVRTNNLSESDTVKRQIDIFTLGEIRSSTDDDSIASRASR